MKLRSYALPAFWACYDALPEDVQEQADKQYAVFELSPNHPSLRFKEVGPFWSVRISRHYRALARRRGNDLYWFWIGRHAEYDRFLR